MSLKDQEILMEKPHTKNEQEMLMDDPLYTLLKDLRLENPKFNFFTCKYKMFEERSKCTS